MAVDSESSSASGQTTAGGSSSTRASSSDGGLRLTPRTRAQGPESVLVVGGGATGIVSLRNLVEERGEDAEGSYPLFEPLLVERREALGGVWYWSDETYALEQRLGPARVQGQSPIVDEHGKPHWPSPAYLNLRGNVLPEFLEFSGSPFKRPQDGETFPSLQETCDYLQEFARPYSEYVRCKVEVVRIDELSDDQGWQVTLRYWDRPGEQIEVRHFDRVLVAAGWYDTPFYPDVPGTSEAREAGHIHHCKHYRDSFAYAPTVPPKAPRAPRVVVVGNNNSANEVATHLALFATPQHPVYKSCKTAQIAKCPSLPDERVRDVGLITKYTLKQAAADDPTAVLRTKLDLTLADGSVIDDVDYVILGTGYGQKYPFLHVLPRDAHGEVTGTKTVPLTPEELKGTRVPGMYNHALWSPSHRLSLGFVGLVVSFWPFNMADLMSAWVSAVWAGKIASVPASVDERLQFERERLDYLYHRKLASLAAAADPNAVLSTTITREDTTTYASGYHLIGGSLADGPPNELDFARSLLADLTQYHPERASGFAAHHSWDAERERKQNLMYEIKRQWLHTHADRIRKDPFDLLGTSANSRKYRHLAVQPAHGDQILLVHPDLLNP